MYFFLFIWLFYDAVSVVDIMQNSMGYDKMIKNDELGEMWNVI
jgi:hypothetical protein